MWQGHYETTTDVPAETLFRAIADVNRWNQWDAGLELTAIDGAPTEGATFVLKPKGGPKVRMSIEELRPPVRLTDVAHLALAKMRTTHEFLQAGGQTTVRVTVKVSGPLSFFWRKVVAEKQITEAAAQTASLIHYARTNVAADPLIR
jgi:uncharacterized protein YndB with AHSA1/START domain